eukprot:TRINITY_DN13146_c0_g1_i1.p2 TRINITY_DN13146_c0_g1~~TRINITY_DN13146_c0_g1_i1.p2  ORF type:complete len:695 (+),score=234.92 TRINITY_DN13146_c0_g1_i1:105-2189(+)
MAAAQRRLATISEHLQPRSGGDERVAPQEARSLMQWGSDLWAMATQEVEVTERHGGDLVAEVLKAHGVQWIFCLAGGHISPFLVASKREGIRIVDTRHEVNAVFAADAVARLTGVPGVAAVTAGPGVTNTVTAIKNAQMAQSPVVLLGGAAATVMKGRGALQDIDQMAVLRPIVKYCATCSSARDIVPTLREALRQAVSGVPGPVFVELPLDVLYPYTEMMPQIGRAERLRARDLAPGGPRAKDVKRVILPKEAGKVSKEEYVRTRNGDAPVFVAPAPGAAGPGLGMSVGGKLIAARIHAGAHLKQDYGPLPVHIPQPTAGDVSKAVELLRAAKRPVVLVGSQATIRGPKASAELRDALEKIGAPCFLGGMARGLLGRNNPIHIRQNRGGALKRCDLVIMLGAVADFRLQYGSALPSGKPIITVNRCKEDLTKNAPWTWQYALASPSDPSLFFCRVAAELTRQGPKAGALASWAGKLKDEERAKEAANSKKAGELAVGRGSRKGEKLLNPIALVEQLEAMLPEDSILVADGGDFVATASYIVRPRGPLTWLDPGAFGTLGVGGGFALGAKLARPSAQVWLLWGDGSAGYSVAEFDSCTRHQAPVIALIGNDASWMQIQREQEPMFGDAVSCELEYSRYDLVAQGYGGVGYEVRDQGDDVGAVIRKAQEDNAAGRAVLINAHIGQTNFREGSLSV